MEVVSDEAKVSVLLQEAFGCEVVETQLSFYDELLITSYFLFGLKRCLEDSNVLLRIIRLVDHKQTSHLLLQQNQIVQRFRVNYVTFN